MDNQEVKLFDSELKVMDILWKEGDKPAGQLAKLLGERTGWNRNTTYTVIKKLVQKGAIERYGNNFTCRPLVARESVQKQEASELMVKLFDGSPGLFLSSYLSGRKLSQDEIDRLKRIVDDLQ